MKKIITSGVNVFTVALFALCLQFNNSSAQTGNFGLNFDGVDDRCTINDNAAYDLGTGNFTIEAWIKSNSSQSSYATILSNRDNAGGSTGVMFYIYYGKVSMILNGNNVLYGSTGIDLRDNYCHQVAVTRSSNTLTLYVDGNVVTSSTISSQSITSAHNIWIGRDEYYNNLSMFKGMIHEVRFWNIARTQSQIQAARNSFLVGNESGLIGYWRMNENAGQTFNDYTPTNNDGFLGTVNTTDAADPIWLFGCYCTPLPPSITPGGPTVFCTGGSVVLTASSGTGITYQWKKNGTNISGATLQAYSATTSGSYKAEINSGGCTALSNAITVYQDTPLTPTITAWGGGFCSSTTVILQTEYQSTYTYQWFEDPFAIPGATASNVNTGHNGDYSVSITNACGTYNSGIFNFYDPSLASNPFGSITTSDPTNICTGGSVYMYDPNTGLYQSPTFQWYLNGVAIPGANSSDYSATQAGNYCMSVYDYNWVWGCTTPTVFSNSIGVTTSAGTYPSVSISTGNATTFCAPGTVVMQATASGSAPLTYQWTKDWVAISGATNTTYTASVSGTYRCEVYNACGGMGSNPIVVSAQTLTATISSNTTNICTGGTVSISCNQQGGNSYQWKLNGNIISGATLYYYNASTAGNYTCTITNLCGNITSNTIAMTVKPLPTAAISGTQTICSGNPAALTVTFTGTAPWYGWIYNGTSYTNFNTSSNPYTINYSPTFNTTYTLYSSMHDAYCNGSVSGSAVVTVNGSSPVANISPIGSTTFCQGGSVQLNSSTGAGYVYQWKKNGVNISGATGFTYIVNSTGSYTVKITNACGTATSSAVVVTVHSNPSAVITPSGPTTICDGQSVTLSVTSGTNKVYQWKKGGVNISGATASTYVTTIGGNYKATVTNTVTGCSSTTSSSTVVTLNPLPSATITPQGPTTFCAGGSVLLKGNSGTGFTYQWKKGGVNIPGATNKNYTATLPGVYKIKVTDANGCSKLSTGVTVTVPCKDELNAGTVNTGSEGIDFIVYPNPTLGEFTIQFSEIISEPVQIEIVDLIGRVLEKFETKEQTVVLNRSNLASGIYYLSATTKDKMVVKKFSVTK